MFVYMVMVIVITSWCHSVRGQLLDHARFADVFKNFTEEEMALQKFQEHFDSNVKYEELPIDGKAIVDTLAMSVSTKFRATTDSVVKLRDVLQAEFDNFTNYPTISSCCETELNKVDHNLARQVNLDTMCIYGKALKNHEPKKYATPAVLDVMKTNLQRFPRLQYQYFGTEDGINTVYPSKRVCTDTYDPRFRPWYSQSASGKPKAIVIVIDRSGSMADSIDNGGSNSRMNIAIDAARTIMKTLNPTDWLGVVAFSDNAGTLISSHDECYATELAEASPWNKEYLMEYVTGLFPNGNSNYVQAVRKAFSFFSGFKSAIQESEKVIMFLSDGMFRNNHSESDILHSIAAENRKLNNTVRILTYGIGEAGTDKHAILIKMAEQTKSDPSFGAILKGHYTPIFSGKNLRELIGIYYRHLRSSSDNMSSDADKVIFTVPYLDSFGAGLITSVCAALKYNHTLFGVACIDVLLRDLMGEVTDLHLGAQSYAFVMTDQSRIMVHPMLPDPSDMKDGVLLHMRIYEIGSDAEIVRRSMINRESGQRNGTCVKLISRGTSYLEGLIAPRVPCTYYWTPVNNTDLSVCVVVRRGTKQIKVKTKDYDKRFKYHVADQSENTDEMCNLFGYPTWYNISVVKFSPKAFANPGKYVESNESFHSKNYSSYMTGDTDKNIYFKNGIRESVAITAAFYELVKECNATIVRKYLGTDDGVLRVIPGFTISKEFDHTLTHWYRQTVGNKGRVIFSPPYNDTFGAGYVISISHTLYQGSESGVHSYHSDHVAVLGMDLKIQELNYVLNEIYPVCKEDKYTCFVVNSNGFIILHPSFNGNDLKSDNDLPMHIASAEEYIAGELKRMSILKPEGCIDFGQIRNYSYWRIILPEGKPVLTYQFEIYGVQNTNIYLIMRKGPMTNQLTCPSKCMTHKPCGEGTVCPCPCYSAARYHYCNNTFLRQEISRMPCTPGNKNHHFENKDDGLRAVAKRLPNCAVVNCSGLSEIECGWYGDCEWLSERDSHELVAHCRSVIIEKEANTILRILLVAGIVLISVLGLVLALAWHSIKKLC